MAGGAVRVMNEVREAYGVVIPPFCRCAAAALVAKCGAAAPRREEQFFRRSRNTHTYSLDHRMWQQGYHQGYAIPEWCKVWARI